LRRITRLNKIAIQPGRVKLWFDSASWIFPDGIVPGDYQSTIDPTTVMFPDMFNLGCKDNCMDMQKGYYDNILNDEAQANSLFLDLQE
jgi:hypothetical protein